MVKFLFFHQVWLITRSKNRTSSSLISCPIFRILAVKESSPWTVTHDLCLWSSRVIKVGGLTPDNLSEALSAVEESVLAQPWTDRSGDADQIMLHNVYCSTYNGNIYGWVYRDSMLLSSVLRFNTEATSEINSPQYCKQTGSQWSLIQLPFVVNTCKYRNIVIFSQCRGQG